MAIKLAQYYNTEIISADSRQFFKEMSIGTAVPDTEELASAKHHFIQHKTIAENYNVGAFEKDALVCLNKLFKTYDSVVMVGGSGLYIDAVCKGLDHFPEVDKSIRENLNKTLNVEGLEALQLLLKSLDEVSFNTIELNNPRRVIRALEICIGTNKPYSSFLEGEKNKRNFNTITIGITADRPVIYAVSYTHLTLPTIYSV